MNAIAGLTFYAVLFALCIFGGPAGVILAIALFALFALMGIGC